MDTFSAFLHHSTYVAYIQVGQETYHLRRLLELSDKVEEIKRE
jgi:hypothetical protein